MAMFTLAHGRRGTRHSGKIAGKLMEDFVARNKALRLLAAAP